MNMSVQTKNMYMNINLDWIVHMELKEKIFKNFIVWITGGTIYYFSEILCRGYSHFSMLLCGGFCFLFVGIIGSRILDTDKNRMLAIIKIMIIGAMIITSLEYITGMIVNVRLNLNVWDYSDMKYNVNGQICGLYSFFWALLSLICVYIYNIMEEHLLKNNQT